MKIKELNKKIILGLLFVFTFLIFSIIRVNAAVGSVTLGFSGATTAEVGKNVTINVALKNVVGTP